MSVLDVPKAASKPATWFASLARWGSLPLKGNAAFVGALVATAAILFAIPANNARATEVHSPCDTKGDGCTSCVGSITCDVEPVLLRSNGQGCCEDFDGDGKCHYTTSQYEEWLCKKSCRYQGPNGEFIISNENFYCQKRLNAQAHPDVPCKCRVGGTTPIP
jgi:hypothetical protein